MSAQEETAPLRQAIREWWEYTYRETQGDLPTKAEVALTWALLDLAWKRLGDPRAVAVWHDEWALIERETSRCARCTRRGHRSKVECPYPKDKAA